jgi:hypothetical protein
MGSQTGNFHPLRSVDFGILKSTFSVAAVDFGVTEIKIVAKYMAVNLPAHVQQSSLWSG